MAYIFGYWQGCHVKYRTRLNLNFDDFLLVINMLSKLFISYHIGNLTFLFLQLLLIIYLTTVFCNLIILCAWSDLLMFIIIYFGSSLCLQIHYFCLNYMSYTIYFRDRIFYLQKYEDNLKDMDIHKVSRRNQDVFLASYELASVYYEYLLFQNPSGP